MGPGVNRVAAAIARNDMRPTGNLNWSQLNDPAAERGLQDRRRIVAVGERRVHAQRQAETGLRNRHPAIRAGEHGLGGKDKAAVPPAAASAALLIRLRIRQLPPQSSPPQACDRVPNGLRATPQRTTRAGARGRRKHRGQRGEPERHVYGGHPALQLSGLAPHPRGRRGVVWIFIRAPTRAPRSTFARTPAPRSPSDDSHFSTKALPGFPRMLLAVDADTIAASDRPVIEPQERSPGGRSPIQRRCVRRSSGRGPRRGWRRTARRATCSRQQRAAAAGA